MAVKFGIRNYSRAGNVVTFTVVALNADGSIDTGYTGAFTWGPSNMTEPADATFGVGDAGQRTFSATIIDPTIRGGIAANFPGASTGANLSVSGPNGSSVAFGNQGDHLIIGGNGTDAINGNNGNDLFMMQQGGDDTLSGGAGDDGFYFGAAYTSADTVDGGAGARDQIGLQGNYSGGVSLGSMLNTELVVLIAGNDTRFGDTANNSYDYNITANAGTIVSNNRLIIQANQLRVGEDFTFNGSASAIDFLIYGGFGTDNLTGGSGNDGFFFGQGRFGASDVVDGGAGTMDQLGLQGNYSITFGAGQLSGLEFIVLMSASDNRFGAGGGTVNYDLTMNDGNVAAGQKLIVSANTLQSNEHVYFNGSAETNGRFELYGGSGNDVLTGGSGDDIIFGGARGDTLTGGAGNDIFAYSSYADSNSTERDGIQDFNAGDRIDLSRLDANLNLDGNQDFTFVGGAAFSGTAGELRFENVSLGGPIWLIQADANGDGVSDLEIILVISPADPITVNDFIGVNAPPVQMSPLTALGDGREGLRFEMRFDHHDMAIVPTTDLLV